MRKGYKLGIEFAFPRWFRPPYSNECVEVAGALNDHAFVSYFNLDEAIVAIAEDTGALKSHEETEESMNFEKVESLEIEYLSPRPFQLPRNQAQNHSSPTETLIPVIQEETLHVYQAGKCTCWTYATMGGADVEPQLQIDHPRLLETFQIGSDNHTRLCSSSKEFDSHSRKGIVNLTIAQPSPITEERTVLRFVKQTYAGKYEFKSPSPDTEISSPNMEETTTTNMEADKTVIDTTTRYPEKDVEETSPIEPGQFEMIIVGMDAASQLDQKTQRLFPVLRQKVRKLADYSIKNFPLTGHLVIMLSWIMIMTFIVAFTFKNMYYLNREGEIRELLLKPQNYILQFPLNSLEVNRDDFLQLISKGSSDYTGTSVCFDETGSVIVTLYENQTSTLHNRMWIHGRLKKNFEHTKGKISKLVPDEAPVYPEQHGAHGLLLKISVFMSGTSLIVIALFYSSSKLKNFIGMAIQLAWMLANLYWVELVEGGASKMMEAILCGIARFQPFH